MMMSQLSPQAPQIPAATESDEQVERRLRILTKIIEWLGIKSADVMLFFWGAQSIGIQH